MKGMVGEPLTRIRNVRPMDLQPLASILYNPDAQEIHQHGCGLFHGSATVSPCELPCGVTIRMRLGAVDWRPMNRRLCCWRRNRQANLPFLLVRMSRRSHGQTYRLFSLRLPFVRFSV